MDLEQPKDVCEEKIFQQLFLEHAKHLFQFLFYKSGNASLSEDLVQEAFLRLWQACKKVTPQKAKSFLYKVGSNLFLDQVKHQKVVRRYQLNPLPKSTPQTPEEVLEEEEFRLQLEAAIAALSEKQRVVFLLNRIEKRTYREIAELLEISVKAVEKRMHKALIELRKFYKDI